MFFLIGTIPEAFLGSGRKESRFDRLLTGAGIFGTGCARAGHCPTYWVFAAALVMIGIATLSHTNTTNSLIQLETAHEMRRLIMALRVGVGMALGGTPIDAPNVRWVANSSGHAGHSASARSAG